MSQTKKPARNGNSKRARFRKTKRFSAYNKARNGASRKPALHDFPQIGIHNPPPDAGSSWFQSQGRLDGMTEKSYVSTSILTPSGYFNRKQLADYLMVSERTISNMVRQRRIPVIKFGRSVRFDPVRVRKAMSKYEIEAI